ncbi:MAG: class A beta-lactamase-related serine hydrolase [Lactobacillaceae bacterium]|jgi:hypothetical protein|nr:class A beta-lactamase-related serine hydrolase [Lactobacillaceae bacterium]
MNSFKKILLLLAATLSVVAFSLVDQRFDFQKINLDRVVKSLISKDENPTVLENAKNLVIEQKIRNALPKNTLLNMQVAVFDKSRSKTFVASNNKKVTSYPTASIVKVAIAYRTLSKEINQPQILANMLMNSSNVAATSLYLSSPNLNATFKQLKMTNTFNNSTWGLTMTTANDQLKLLQAIFNHKNSDLTEKQALEIQTDMNIENVAKDQNWGISNVANARNIYLKNGWLYQDEYGWIINSIGSVELKNGHQYLIAILTNGGAGKGNSIVQIEKTASKIFKILNSK